MNKKEAIEYIKIEERLTELERQMKIVGEVLPGLTRFIKEIHGLHDKHEQEYKNEKK